VDDSEGSRVIRIAHISDLHCGSPYFVPDLMERAIMEINELEPAIVICSGDLTAYGFRPEYAEAKSYLDRLMC
jgi:3',5'-cyclic AMP phosphodiesterase CpdA